MINFKGYVRLTTLSRDPETGGYRMDTELVLKKDLPVEAVHNTGDRNGFTIDNIKVKYPYREDENGFTAIDLNLWLESNDINDALALKWDGLKMVEPKHVVLIGAITIAIVVVVYVVMRGL